jgi:hypothetical protein
VLPQGDIDEDYGFEGSEGLPIDHALWNPDSLLTFAICKFMVPSRRSWDKLTCIAALAMNVYDPHGCFVDGYRVNRVAFEERWRQDQRNAATHAGSPGQAF